jgi:segregation and condensation protein B
MRTLQERNWIRVVGHREVPGHPELLGTTRDFLDYFGLRSLDQLPTLAELRDVETIGVQLELPGGEAPADALAEETEATAELATDESDVPVDAAPEDADDAASPSLVASADDEEPGRRLGEPPAE